MKVGAVILAGGIGSRFAADVPKQFVSLNGKPIWQYAYDSFKNHEGIGSVVIVFPEDSIPEDTNTLNVAISGKTRRQSVFNGLTALKEIWGDCQYVLIHDAARPLISSDIISRCIQALKNHDAVDVSIPSADTIIQVDPAGKTVELVTDRRRMRLGQTPQGFELQHILDAHRSVPVDTDVTDDIGLLRIFDNNQLKFLIANVDGDERNMKITTQADLIKAERMAREIPANGAKIQSGNALIWGGTGGIGSEVVKTISSDPRSNLMVWGSDDCRLSGTHEALYRIDREFLDYLVVSVGTLKEVAADDSWTAWDDEFDNNFTHISRFLGTVKRRGIMKKGGSIVVVGSSSAYQGRSKYTAYCSAKAALMNFVQGFSQEWTDVRLNVVNPGRCKTSMREKMFGKEPEESLISAEDVSKKIVSVLGMDCSGCIFDIRVNGIEV